MIKLVRNILVIRKSKLTCIALMTPITILTIQFFFIIYFNLLNTSLGIKIQLLSKAIVGAVFLFSFPYVFKEHCKKNFFTYLLFLLIFLSYSIFFPQNDEHIKTVLFPMFFINLPVFIYASSISDFVEFEKVLNHSGKLIFIFGFWLAFLVFLGHASLGAYSMSFAYYMLLPTIIFINRLFEKLSVESIIFSFISFFLILALGSRGPILCIFVFIILKFIKTKFKFSHTMLFIYTCIFFIIIIFLTHLSALLKIANDILLLFGIKSRSIALFLREGSIHLSGRDILFQNVWVSFSENFLFGLGLAGDRVALEGTYVHNFFVEVLAHYGILFASIIFFILFYFIIKAFLIKNTTKSTLFIILFSLGFVHLLVSSSYLIDLKFWLFLGFLFNKNLYKERA